MATLRASLVQSPSLSPRRLAWILSFVSACSVYDGSLLGAERNAGSSGGGGSHSTGGAATSGGRSPQEGGTHSGGRATGGEETGGGTSGGSSSSRGGSTTAQGGNDVGGNDAGGSDAGGSDTGGETGGSQTGGTGGSAITTGGAPTNGGTMMGGASKGGSSSTGGSATGGSSPTGGSATGGTTSTGGTNGGTAGSGGSDACPSDPNKLAPGICGCGIPEEDSGGNAGCLGLRSALVHRYTFSGSGMAITDSVGTAHGTAINASVASGTLVLSNTGSEQYVDLPNRLVSVLSDATLEVWVTWSGTATWQRIFEFGSSTTGEGTRELGQTYLFATPKSGTGYLTAAFSTAGTGAEVTVAATSALPSGVKSHVTVVVSDSADLMTLYLNGTSVGSAAFTGHLSSVDDVNDWLGRSQSKYDSGFAGTLHEVRIYNTALSVAQIQLTERTGESPAFF